MVSYLYPIHSIKALKEVQELTLEEKAKFTEVDLEYLEDSPLTSNLFEGLTGVTKIHFNHSWKKRLPKDLLIEMPNLEEVKFVTCKVASIPPTLFAHSPKLQHAAFLECPIRTIPKDLFSQNKELRYVDFINTNLFEVPDGLLDANPNVEMCNFNLNPLTLETPTRLRDDVHLLACARKYVLVAAKNKIVGGMEHFFSPQDAYDHWKYMALTNESPNARERGIRFANSLLKHFKHKINPFEG